MATFKLVNADMLLLTNAVIEGIPEEGRKFSASCFTLPDEIQIVDEDTITKLGALFPQNMVVSALDLLDRHNGT